MNADECLSHDLCEAPEGQFVCSYAPRDNAVTDLLFSAADALKFKCTEVGWREFMPTPPPLGARLFIFKIGK
jgi:hypothetical protein